MNELFYKMISKEKAELEAVRKKTIDAYWAEHADEKMALDAEKKTLVEKIENLNSEIASLPEVKAELQIEIEIESLKKEKSELSFFKRKEKNALQEQIDSLKTRLITANAAKNNAAAPLKAEIDEFNKRIKEIETELTMDR